MTAPILEPGDRIHLAIPANNRPNDLANELKALYARQYVTVIGTILCPSLTRPEIIAVFRPREQDPS